MTYTTVDFKFIKHEFDNGQVPRFEILKWLFDNVGESNLTNPANPDWFRDFSYSNDEFGSYIIVTYSFKNKKDATFFSLKWPQ